MIVYIKEAHPVNGWMLYDKGFHIYEHRNLDERLAAANHMAFLGLPCPLAIDNMDNTLNYRLQAVDERLAVINGEGRLVWIGKQGAENYSVQEARHYLNTKFKKSQ